MWLKADVGTLNIPLDSTPFFLDEVYGSVRGIETPPFIISLTTSFSGGPNFFDGLFKMACFNDVGFEIDISSYVTLMGTAGLFCSDALSYASDGVITFTGEGTFDWRSSVTSLNGTLKTPFDIFTGEGNLSINSTGFSGQAAGNLKIPLWIFGGLPLLGGNCSINREGIACEMDIFFNPFDKTDYFTIAASISSEIARENRLDISNYPNAIQRYIKIGTNLTEIGNVASNQFLKLDTASGPAGTSSINIPPSLEKEKAIIKMNWEKGDATLNLTTPDGLKITKEYADAHPEWLSHIKSPRDAWYVLKNPKSGSWQVEVSASGSGAGNIKSGIKQDVSNDIGKYSVSLNVFDVPPRIEITSPTAKVTTGTNLAITFNAYDPDDTAKISLHYDTDNAGADGIMIVDNLLENDGAGSYTWDVTNVPAGTYYIYAIINDGKNAPVVAYSSGSVEVVHPQAPQTPPNVRGSIGGNAANLQWDPVSNIEGYKVYYTDDLSIQTYKNMISVGNNITTYIIDNLKPGATYLFAMSSFNAQGIESMKSDPITLVVPNVATPKIDVSPDVIDFGTVKLGDTSVKNVTIGNTGGADLAVSEIAFYGTGSKLLRLEALSFPLVLKPGESRQIQITLNMTSLLVVNSSLVIKNNDPDYPNKMIPVKASLKVGDYIFLSTPSPDSGLKACNLYSGQIPTFSWQPSDTVYSKFTIEFSSDASFAGNALAKANTSTTDWVPSAGTMKKIMKLGGTIYWRVTGIKADKTSVKSEARSLFIDNPDSVTINSPEDNANLSPDVLPIFEFYSNCNVKFKLEFSSLSTFGDITKIKAFNLTIKVPNENLAVDWALSSSKWTTVKKLIGTGVGYYRIRSWDGLNRETSSEIRSFTVYTQSCDYTLAVNINPGGAGTVSKNPDKSVYCSGEQVMLAAIPTSGFTFSSWTGVDSSSSTIGYITMNGNRTVTANFSQSCIYTLSVGINPLGSGTVTKNPDKAAYCSGEQVTFSANPNSGYTFSSWSGVDSSNGATAYVTMNGNRTVTANFSQNCTNTLSVNVSPSGSGSVTKSPDKNSYCPGEQVRLFASPASGYSFSSWSGVDSSNGATAYVIMNGSRTVTANFSQSITNSVLYIPYGGNPNAYVNQILANHAFTINQQTQVPNDLSGYRLIILGSYEASNPTAANKIKNFVQNGGGVIIQHGCPKLLAGDTDDLTSIQDWFGAGIYGNDGGYGTVTTANPLGTGLSVNDKIDFSSTSCYCAAAIYNLNSDASLISEWEYGGIHSFVHMFGQGRVFFYAGNPGYVDSPENMNAGIINNSLTLFEAGLLWTANL